MTFEQLKYFIALAEGESFLEVAEKLYISQSSLSKQIKKLEEELEVTLFDRSGRKAKLNEAGEYFYLEAKRLVEEYEKLFENMKGYKNKKVLSIGVLPISSQYNLNFLFQEFKKNYPEIELIIDEQEELVLKQGIFEQKYDFIIARDMFEKDLINCEVVAKDKVVAVFSCSHSLNQNNFIDFNQLDKKKILMMNSYTTVYKKITRLFQEKNIKPSIIRMGRVESLVDYVKLEEGIALIPFQSLKIFQNLELNYLPVTPLIDLEVFLIKDKKKSYSESMRLFYEFIKNNRAISK